MSGDDFYDDDFNSADENSRLSGSSSRSPSPQVHSRSPSPCAGSRGYSPKSNNALLPIVEVPTSSENGMDSVRSDSANLSRTNNSGSEDDNSDNEEGRSKKSHCNKQSSDRRSNRRRSKSRKDPQHIDMTPPEKHLRKAEKKAKKYLEKNKTDDGIKLLVQCTALARIVYGDGHWKLAKAYTNLAEAYIDKKGWMPQAQYHAESAKSIMLGGVHLSNSSAEKPLIMEVLISINYLLGRALTMLKKHPEAEQALNKAESLIKDYARLSSVREEDVEEWDIKIYTAIAKLNARQKKFALATTNFEKALEMMKSKYGPDAVELIPLYQSLGKVEQSKGKHAHHMRAIEYYLHAHSIATANYKENSIHVAETAKALANAYSNTGDEDAEASAESYLNDCLSIYQAVYGPHHPDTIETEDELARLMIRMDRQEEGLSLLLSGIEAKKEVFGDLSTEVAETWKLIGNVHLAQGNTEKALRALKKCYNIECSIYGTNNKKSKDTQRVIDILMANPNVAAKQKKSSSDQLKERPRFNTIVKGSQNVGGYKIPEF